MIIPMDGELVLAVDCKGGPLASWRGMLLEELIDVLRGLRELMSFAGDAKLTTIGIQAKGLVRLRRGLHHWSTFAYTNLGNPTENVFQCTLGDPPAL